MYKRQDEYPFFDEAVRAAKFDALRGNGPAAGPTEPVLNTARPNVVIVILESFARTVMDAEVGGEPVMPYMQRLKGEGIWFENFFANSFRTDRGEVAILSGFPAQTRMSIMKLPAKSRNLPSIARSLAGEGYATSFAYGGDLSSDAYNRAGRCYGQYISPIAGYKFRCAVWYQGEGQPSRYAESMLKLIEGWRRDFGYELPFLIVQLPRYGENDTLPDQYASMGLNMPSISLTPFQIREEQKKITEQATKCTYSVNVDLGDYDELHPYDKKPVGMRAAYKVMEYFYGTQGIWSGARLDRAVLEGSKVKLYFKNVGGGIVVKNNGINLEVAGSDGVYYPATIEKTESDCVIIGCGEVSAPVSVRYGANNYPRIDRNDVSLYMSLFTSEGFPVEQFIASLA